MINESNQIHKFIPSSGSGTIINYGSGSDFLTNYGSDSGSSSTSQKVTVPTVPVPQRWLKLADSVPYGQTLFFCASKPMNRFYAVIKNYLSFCLIACNISVILGERRKNFPPSVWGEIEIGCPDTAGQSRKYQVYFYFMFFMKMLVVVSVLYIIFYIFF